MQLPVPLKVIEFFFNIFCSFCGKWLQVEYLLALLLATRAQTFVARLFSEKTNSHDNMVNHNGWLL